MIYFTFLIIFIVPMMLKESLVLRIHVHLSFCSYLSPLQPHLLITLLSSPYLRLNLTYWHMLITSIFILLYSTFCALCIIYIYILYNTKKTLFAICYTIIVTAFQCAILSPCMHARNKSWDWNKPMNLALLCDNILLVFSVSKITSSSKGVFVQWF